MYIPYIFRHIASGADDALLCIGHVEQVNGTGLIVDCHRDKTAFNLAKPKINPLKIHQVLQQLVDGINEIPPVPEYYSERQENQ